MGAIVDTAAEVAEIARRYSGSRRQEGKRDPYAPGRRLTIDRSTLAGH